MNRPNPIQWIGYAFGRRLPDSLRDWVRNDLTGKYATPRHIMRGLVPFTPLFVVFSLFPGELWLRGSMVLLALLLALFYTTAFMPMNRAHRLAKHGLPADLQNPERARRQALERATYAAQHPHRFLSTDRRAQVSQGFVAADPSIVDGLPDRPTRIGSARISSSSNRGDA